jgi:hypothetical protein
VEVRRAPPLATYGPSTFLLIIVMTPTTAATSTRSRAHPDLPLIPRGCTA